VPFLRIGKHSRALHKDGGQDEVDKVTESVRLEDDLARTDHG
jgi:hypothetical protein